MVAAKKAKKATAAKLDKRAVRSAKLHAEGRAKRAKKRETNKAAFATTKKELAAYMPPPARARYGAIIEEMKTNGEIITALEQQQAVLSLIIGGLSLRWARETVGVSHWQWHQWLHSVEGLKEEYALAKDERSEAWADDIMEDAESANAFNAQAVRLRIDTKKWLMGKNSGRYADRTNVDVTHVTPLEINHNASAEDKQRAYKQIMGPR